MAGLYAPLRAYPGAKLISPRPRAPTVAQVVVLAGGEGSRLFPLTAWTPKPLLPIRGVPLLVHTLRKLKREGWTDVVVCINEAHRDQFEYHVSTVGNEIKVRLSTHPRSEELGTAGEIAAAARFIKGGDYFLVYYGDILTTLDTGAMRAAYEGLEQRPAAFVAVAEKYRTDKGIAVLAGGRPPGEHERTVKEIREKPELDLPNLMGIDILRNDVLEQLAIGEDLHRDVLPRLLGSGLNVMARVVGDDYLDIGSVDAYRRAQSWKAP